MSFHFIEDEGLKKVLRAATAKERDAALAAIERWLRRQPTAPRLVGGTAAAEILGIHPPHISRLKEQGRMPEPIPIEGSFDVYVREEVEALARELEAERRARKRRREAVNS